MPSARTRSGSVPTQNFDQSRSRTDIGFERSSQSVRPSRLTAGKKNRAEIEASTTTANARTASRSVTNHSFDQSRSLTDIGLERSIHGDRRSKLTAGKSIRAAIEASAKPASARFRNGITLTGKSLIPSARNGRNLM